MWVSAVGVRCHHSLTSASTSIAYSPALPCFTSFGVCNALFILFSCCHLICYALDHALLPIRAEFFDEPFRSPFDRAFYTISAGCCSPPPPAIASSQAPFLAFRASDVATPRPSSHSFRPFYLCRSFFLCPSIGECVALGHSS